MNLSSLAQIKSRMETLWYWLTWLVLENGFGTSVVVFSWRCRSSIRSCRRNLWLRISVSSCASGSATPRSIRTWAWRNSPKNCRRSTVLFPNTRRWQTAAISQLCIYFFSPRYLLISFYQPFSALTLLVGWQEGCLAVKVLAVVIPKVLHWKNSGRPRLTRNDLQKYRSVVQKLQAVAVVVLKIFYSS